MNLNDFTSYRYLFFSFFLPVTATADNSLFTCFPFLAQHRMDHQIVCEQGHSLRGRKTVSRESVGAGEAVLVPCDTPARSMTRASTTETSSNFEISSSSYESSSASGMGMTAILFSYCCVVSCLNTCVCSCTVLPYLLPHTCPSCTVCVVLLLNV